MSLPAGTASAESPVKADLVLYGSTVQLRPGRNLRRGSSLVKMSVEDGGPEEQAKAVDKAETPEKGRRSLDNTYRHSLESISEYRPRAASSSPLYPSLEYSLESPSCSENTFLNSTSGYLSWIETVSAECSEADMQQDRSGGGEWHNFWTNYNSSRGEYFTGFSRPHLCPSNSAEDVSVDSNCSTHRATTDRSKGDHVSLTLDEINETLHHSQRITEILKGALQRYESSEADHCPSNSDKSDKNKNVKPTTGNSCINLLLGQTGVADMLKRVINKRRDILMPQVGSRKNSASDQ